VACAAALAATLSDPAETERRVRRAFRHVQRFSIERFVNDTDALLDEAARVMARA
jgi:hypothetical protein